MNEMEAAGRRAKQKERLSHWHTIIDSGELQKAQNHVNSELKKMVAEGSWRADWDNLYSKAGSSGERRAEGQLFHHPGLETQPRRFRFRSTGPHTVYLGSDQPRLTRLENTFLQTFSFLDHEISEMLNEEQFSRTAQLPPEVRHAYAEGTDLRTIEGIVVDNVFTYADVFRFVTRDAVNSQEQLALMRRVATERSDYRYMNPSTGQEINLNPRMETDLELLARAPFSFWANTRDESPFRLDGEEVLQTSSTDAPLFSPRFIYFVTRENIMADTLELSGQNLPRHGGCPVLQRDNEQQGLIPETANTFIDFYEAVTRPLSDYF